MNKYKIGGFMKIRLAYIEDDIIYSERFLGVINSYYPDKVEIHIFSDEASFLNMYKIDKYDIVLIGENISNKNFGILSDELVIYMVNSPIINSNDISERNRIYKFQNIGTIYNEIIAFLSEKSTFIKAKQNNSNPVEIVSFLSYGSSVGTSTLAASYSINSSLHKKVLYIDLQVYPTLCEVFKGEGNMNLSDIIYYIKSGKTNLVQKIEGVIQKDSSGIYFIAPCTNALERCEITEDIIKMIIEAIKEICEFELLVIDTDFSFSETENYLLDISDKLIFAKTDNLSCMSKFKYMIDTLKLLQNKSDKNYLSKCIAINNLNTGKQNMTNNDSESNLDIREGCCISEYKGISKTQLIKILSESDLFVKI